MIDTVASADAWERDAHLAWHEYCALVQVGVAQGRVSAAVAVCACDAREKRIWMRAYRGIRRRAVGLGELEAPDDVDGPQERPPPL